MSSSYILPAISRPKLYIAILGRPRLISKGNFSKTTERIFKNEGVLESERKGLSSGA